MRRIGAGPILRRTGRSRRRRGLGAIVAPILLGLFHAIPAEAQQTWTTDLTAGTYKYGAGAQPSRAAANPAAQVAIPVGRGGDYAYRSDSGGIEVLSRVARTSPVDAPSGMPDRVYSSTQARSALVSGWSAGLPHYKEADLIQEGRWLAVNPPRDMAGASDLACMAVTVYHESRGQPTLGQQAVASVVLRRVQVRRWGNSICSVVVEPKQFSYMTGPTSFPAIRDMDSWYKAIAVAIRTMVDGPAPEVAGADHYHATYVHPDWGPTMNVVARIGDHIFYRDPKTARFE